MVIRGISTRFQVLSPCNSQIAHALLTRPPLNSQEQALLSPVRLACLKHAASVRPEPGSNSNVKLCQPLQVVWINISRILHLMHFLS